MLDGSRAGGVLQSLPRGTDSALSRILCLDGLVYHVLNEALTRAIAHVVNIFHSAAGTPDLADVSHSASRLERLRVAGHIPITSCTDTFSFRFSPNKKNTHLCEFEVIISRETRREGKIAEV